MLDKKILTIATETRSWAEKHVYCFSDDLEGLCAIASVELFRRLKQQKIEAKIHLASHDEFLHCYVTVNDYVVDLTATQFGHSDKVVVKPHNSHMTIFNWYWRPIKTFDCEKKLIRYQRKIGWSYDQIWTKEQ